MIDGAAFAAEAEWLTNTASIDGWLALYQQDVVAEWIIDGAYERYDGVEAIRPAASLMTELWRAQGFRVRKHLQCATGDCVVLTFDGTFCGRGNVFDSEIWTIRDGLVVHHQMHVFLDVRTRTSQWARFRVIPSNPRPVIVTLRLERRHARR